MLIHRTATAAALILFALPGLSSAAEKQDCEAELFSLDNFKVVRPFNDFDLRYFQETRDRLLKDLKRIDRQIAEMELSRTHSPEKAKAEALAELQAKVAVNPQLAVHVNDYLNFKWIKRQGPELFVLLVGTDGGKVNETELEAAHQRVKRALSAGFSIVLDGHSPYTPALAEAAGKKAVVVATRPVEGVSEEQTLIVTNPYLRLQIFGLPEAITAVSLDSMAGVAELFVGGVSLMMAPSSWEAHEAIQPLANWWRFVSENNFSATGLPRTPKVWTHSEVSARASRVSDGGPRRQLEDWPTEDLRNAAAYANETIALSRAAAGPAAVIFGGARVFEKSNFDTYKLAYEFGRRGIGTVTGGAGGIMLAANMGAFDAGAASVGIPVAGGKVELEARAYKEFQTVTAFASDYETRIPALLSGRRYVIFEPGSTGTMREIAAALYAMSLPQYSDMEIYFVNKKYYEEVFKFIQGLQIAKPLLERIHLAETAEDVIKKIDADPAMAALAAGATPLNPAVRSWTALTDRMRQVERY